MPTRNVPGTNVNYQLLSFDTDGKERPEPDGSLLSDELLKRATDATTPVTHILFMSHGWKGDIPAAIDQYDRWIGAMLAVSADRDAVRRQNPGYCVMIVGLHWPSLPWGDEAAAAGAAGVLSGDDDIDAQVSAYAERIADTPKARSALRSIFAEVARDPTSGAQLSPSLLDSYATLFEESGLDTGDKSGRPGADQDGFDPARIVDEARSTHPGPRPGGQPGLLGADESFRDVLLSPLRQLSFWKMKDRARVIGETGSHNFLTRMQRAAPKAQFHLMGHSFGCIVVSATVAGAPGSQPLPKPVDSVFLVQGALSLWSYAEDIPYAVGTAGYFNRIISQGRVRGPVITTRSTHDAAVGRFYPLGARLKKQLVLGAEYPAYGGIGTFGIRGTQAVEDLVMQPSSQPYNLREGRIYNLDASGVICNGTGASGAHSDIAHPEVAHAFWSAILSAQASAGGGTLWEGSLSDNTDFGSLLQKQVRRRGGLLSPDASPPPPPPPPSPTRAEPPSALKHAEPPLRPTRTDNASRWINAELEDHEPGKPLSKGDWYTLALGVDVERRATAVASIAFDDSHLFSPGIDEIQLTVQLDSDDFDIQSNIRPLRLGATGKGHTKARFDISPRHDGRSIVKATIHKDGNFVQQLELAFDVGGSQRATVGVIARGRPPSAVPNLQPRDFSIMISPSVGGYDCVVFGSVSARAKLPLTAAFLANAADEARRDLMKVVMQQDGAGTYVFQTDITIADAERDIALKTMARAGARLFQKMFFGPSAAADSIAVGEFLRKSASEPGTRLKLQIVAESTPIPWGLIYVGDASEGARLTWDNFLGMRHIIEQIPLQNQLAVSDCVIASDKPQLVISVNVNDGIDAQMESDFVAQQKSFWQATKSARQGIRTVDRNVKTQVVKALGDAATDDQILYFYCHAQSTGLNDAGGPDASCIVMSDARITLGELNLDASPRIQLKGNPLVFINACESAELSPAFYDGFVPYFMSKGARGVVGTECKTPALLAMNWAKRFFEQFLDGNTLGEVFLNLRREFLERHGNPLGLLYGMHCDGDTLIQPALKTA